MGGSEMPDAAELQAFNSKVDEVSHLISGLQAGTIAPDYVDQKQRAEEEAAAAKQKAEAAKRVQQEAADADPERQQRLQEKVEEIKANYSRKQAARRRYEAYVQHQGGPAQRGQTDYKRWELFTPDDEEDDMINAMTPNSPQLREMERDIQARHERMVEQRQVAERQRVKGNELFKQGRWAEATQCYEIGLDAERHNMALHGNMAAALLKQQCWVQAIEHCDKVLHLAEFLHSRPRDPLCVKALQRRAAARRALQHWQEALADLQQAAGLDPSNQEVAEQLLQLQQEKLMHSQQKRVLRQLQGSAAGGKAQLGTGEAAGSSTGVGAQDRIKAVHAALPDQVQAASGPAAQGSSDVHRTAELCSQLQRAVQQRSQPKGLGMAMPHASSTGWGTLLPAMLQLRQLISRAEQAAVIFGACHGLSATVVLIAKAQEPPSSNGAVHEGLKLLLAAVTSHATNAQLVCSGPGLQLCLQALQQPNQRTAALAVSVMAALVQRQHLVQPVCKELARKADWGPGGMQPKVSGLLQALDGGACGDALQVLLAFADDRGVQAALAGTGHGPPAVKAVCRLLECSDAAARCRAALLLAGWCGHHELRQQVTQTPGALAALLKPLHAQSPQAEPDDMALAAGLALRRLLLEPEAAEQAVVLGATQTAARLACSAHKPLRDASAVILSRLVSRPDALPGFTPTLLCDLRRELQSCVPDDGKLDEAQEALVRIFTVLSASAARELHAQGVSQAMVPMLASQSDRAAGNAALYVAHVAQLQEALDDLHGMSAVPLLLDLAHKRTTAGVGKNAGIALSRLAQHPGCLQQLRDLHGVELLLRYVNPA